MNRTSRHFGGTLGLGMHRFGVHLSFRYGRPIDR